MRPLKFQTPERAKIARSGVFLNSFFAVIAGGFFFFRAVGSSSCAKSAVKTAFKRAKHSISDRKSSIHRTSRICRNKGFKRSFAFYRAGKPFFPACKCSVRVRILPAQRNGAFALTRSRPDPPQKAKYYKLKYHKLK